MVRHSRYLFRVLVKAGGIQFNTYLVTDLMDRLWGCRTACSGAVYTQENRSATSYERVVPGQEMGRWKWGVGALIQEHGSDWKHRLDLRDKCYGGPR